MINIESKYRPEKLLNDPVHPERKFYLGILYVGDIKLDPRYLVRELDEKHKNNLKEQIEEEGLIEPITVNEEPNGNLVLLAGQHRLIAMKELNHNQVSAKVYVELDETAKRLIGYMSNETRKRPSAGKRYEALSDIFEEKKQELTKAGKVPSEELIVKHLYFKSSTVKTNELILGIIVDKLRDDPGSLVSKYHLIQNAQVPRRRMEQEVMEGRFPLLTAQNTFKALSNLCRAKPVTHDEEVTNKNFREIEYQNVKQFFNKIVSEFVEPWIQVGAIDTAINFCRIHPFDAFAKIVEELLVEAGLPGPGTSAAPFYHDREIEWDKLFQRLSPLKDNKIWNYPMIEKDRAVKDIKNRLRYMMDNQGKQPDF